MRFSLAKSIAGMMFLHAGALFAAELVQPCECDDLSIQVHQFGDAEWEVLSKIANDDQQLSRALKVYALSGESQQVDADMPAIFGKSRLDVDQRLLSFEPKYPLENGIHYRIEVQTSDAKQVFSLFRPKEEKTPSTVVRAIYPSSDELPENLLKFYIHFSEPMSSGDVYRHIDLIDQDGRHLERPFLEIAEELWDPSGKRLTLLLDPARVKRGLVPHEEDGAILFANRTYRLVIKSDWLDATRTPLKESFTKTFTTIAADYEQPDPKKWKINVPAANESNGLTIQFSESLDHALISHGIRVIDENGKEIDGESSAIYHERCWSFKPELPWKAGKYRLKINERIEDLAGNSIAKPFEVDRFDKIEPITSGFRELTFEIKPTK